MLWTREVIHRKLGRRTALVVFLLALALRLSLLGWACSRGVSPLLGHSWDEQGYHLLAVNLVRHHRFAVANLTTDPELRKAGGFISGLPVTTQRDYLDILDRTRTPGLPVFLAAIYSLAGPSPCAAAVALCLVSALAACLACIAGTYALGNRAGIVAGVLMAASPGAILNACLILSDTLHMALLAGFMLALFLALKRQSPALAVAAGLCLGLAILARPVTLYLPLLLAVGLLLVRVRPAVWAGLLVGAYVVVLPWCARNAVEYGKFQLSDIGTYNMLNFNLPYARARAEGVTVSRASAIYRALQRSMPGMEAELVKEGLRRYWPIMAEQQAVGALIFWVAAEVRPWAEMLGASPTEATARDRMWDAGPLDVAGWALRSPGAAPAIVQAAYNGLVTLLALAGAVLCLRRKVARTEVMVALCCCAYYSLVTGPVASGRFRLAVDPFVAMLAGAAVARLWELARRGKPQPAHEVS